MNDHLEATLCPVHRPVSSISLRILLAFCLPPMGQAKTLFGETHGPRLDTFQMVLQLSTAELHDAHPWTSDLIFNEKLQRGEFDQSKGMSILGTKPKVLPPRDRSPFQFGPRAQADPGRTAHRWVIGNEAGELIPQMLHIAFKAIESGAEEYSDAERGSTDDAQRLRMYAMVREAQLRAIPPFDVSRAAPQPWAS